MRDHKGHRYRLVAKNDVSTLSFAINRFTYAAPELWEMVHGFGKECKEDVRYCVVEVQLINIRKLKTPANAVVVQPKIEKSCSDRLLTS